MRVEYKEVMDRLGVGYILAPYETRPWFLYDAERGISCSAEVRIGPETSDVEAEIQFLYDDRESVSEEDEERPTGTQQILLIRVLPFRDNLWTPKLMFLRGENFVNKIYDWEGKGCDFFRSCIAAVQMGELPDIEALIDEELSEGGSGGRGGRKGRVGKKAPSIKPAALLGMKR